METAQEKVCLDCGVSKPTREFSRCAYRKDGLQKQCKVCQSVRRRDHYERNKAVKLANNRNWKERNPERARMIQRNAYLASTFGITHVDYERMLAAQDGRCANQACRAERAGGAGSFHIDHDHRTGRIRGLLCHNCNRAIGLMKDDPSRLMGAAKYLIGDPQ